MTGIDGVVPTPTRERTVQVCDGRSLRYASYGDPDGRPVLFLHGIPGSRVLGGLFDGPARQAGVRLLAPDRPGYGDSDPDPQRTLADTATDVTAVLDDAGVDRAAVVGFSGGGAVGLALATEYPGRTATLDLVATAVPPGLSAGRPPVQRLLGLLARRTPRVLRALLAGQARLAAHAPPPVVTAQYTDSDARPVPDGVAAVTAADFRTALSSTTRGTVTESALLADDWEVTLDAVRCPVRVWHGEHDTNVPVASARQLAGTLPTGALRVLDGRDHLGTLAQARDHLLAARHAGDRVPEDPAGVPG